MPIYILHICALNLGTNRQVESFHSIGSISFADVRIQERLFFLKQCDVLFVY